MMEDRGGISGEGTLVQRGKDLARAFHDLDGYLTRNSDLTCNSELRCSARVLGAIFQLANLQLRTDDGRVLELQSSCMPAVPSQDAVHVHV